MKVRRTIRPLAALVTTLVAALAAVSAAPQQQPAEPVLRLPKSMRAVPTPYYALSTDLPAEAAQEAALRITRMAEEYRERTRGFSGVVNQRFPIYLFTDKTDYVAAGGFENSTGVFVKRGGPNPQRWIMVYTGTEPAPLTWQTVQQEGFRQYADATIGDLPPWISVGLSEYFAVAIWTGDGFVTGVVRPEWLNALRGYMRDNKLLSAQQIMEVGPEEWRRIHNTTHAIHAWSMVHMLIHGDGGKYQPAFVQFMKAVNRKQPWQAAWQQTFGAAAGFEEKWSQWWAKQADDPTPELYARATLSTLTSFVARAHAQKITLRDLPEFFRLVKNNGLKLTGDKWLPPKLLQEATARMGRDGTTFTLEPGANASQPPKLVAVCPNGTRMVASFPLRYAAPVKVTIDVKQGAVVASARQPGQQQQQQRPPSVPGAVAPPPPQQQQQQQAPAAPPVAPPAAPPALVGPPPASSDPLAPSSPPPVARRDPLAPPTAVGPPPVTVPEPAGGDGPRQLMMAGLPNGREAAVRFITENNGSGMPDHPMVQQATTNIDDALREGNGVSVLIGQNLMKSGRATQVTILDGQCFVLEFTDDEAGPINPGRHGMVTTALRLMAERIAPPPLELMMPTFTDKAPFDPTKRLDGHVVVKGLDRLPPGTYSLRLSYRSHGLNLITSNVYDKRPVSGMHHFIFNAPGAERVKAARPAVVFMDVCRTRQEPGKPEVVEVLSNTIAMVIHFKAPPP